MPELADVLGGRRLAMSRAGSINGKEKYPFFFFCNSVLECVAGKKEWKQQKTKRRVSESCVSVSDEAFAMLLLVNSWDKFEYMAENPAIDERTEVPETRYTEKKGRNRKMQGWSSEGIDNFNKLCLFVIEDRKSEAGQLFESEFLQHQVDKEKERKMGVQEVDGDDDGQEDENDDSEQPQSKKAKWAFNHLQDLAGVGLSVGQNIQEV